MSNYRTPGFTQLECLQSGNYGTAFKERDNETGEIVAIKYIRRGPEVRRLPVPAAAELFFLH